VGFGEGPTSNGITLLPCDGTCITALRGGAADNTENRRASGRTPPPTVAGILTGIPYLCDRLLRSTRQHFRALVDQSPPRCWNVRNARLQPGQKFELERMTRAIDSTGDASPCVAGEAAPARRNSPSGAATEWMWRQQKWDSAWDCRRPLARGQSNTIPADGRPKPLSRKASLPSRNRHSLKTFEPVKGRRISLSEPRWDGKSQLGSLCKLAGWEPPRRITMAIG